MGILSVSFIRISDVRDHGTALKECLSSKLYQATVPGERALLQQDYGKYAML